MQHWSWWLSGVALAGVPVLNWLVVRRLMAVSGRYTALVDRVRLGPPEEAEEMSAEELMAAVRAVTADAFGAEVLDDAQPEESAPPPAAATSRPRSPAMHAVFLLSLCVGGLVSALLAGGVAPSMRLEGSAFATLFGSAPWVMPVVLVFGGALVGFGTRMAAGCTSGHGLCGVSRAQPGSLAATAAFFGMGIVVSLAMEWVL